MRVDNEALTVTSSLDSGAMKAYDCAPWCCSDDDVASGEVDVADVGG